MSAPRVTAAMLCAEEARERWCCPICGGLNNAEALPGRMTSAEGWCQHEACVDRRVIHRQHGIPPTPEILFILAVWVFERRPLVEAA